MAKGDRDARIKLYPELNGLDEKVGYHSSKAILTCMYVYIYTYISFILQDEKLIAYLRDHILIKPPCKRSKKNGSCKNAPKPKLQKSTAQQNLRGQFYQPEYVERLLDLKNKLK